MSNYQESSHFNNHQEDFKFYSFLNSSEVRHSSLEVPQPGWKSSQAAISREFSSMTRGVISSIIVELVVSTHLKNMGQESSWIISQNMGENNNALKPPPSFGCLKPQRTAVKLWSLHSLRMMLPFDMDVPHETPLVTREGRGIISRYRLSDWRENVQVVRKGLFNKIQPVKLKNMIHPGKLTWQ